MQYKAILSPTDKSICKTIFLQEMQSAITRARTYLEARLNKTLNDSYTLALMTYALQTSESSFADEALDALNAHAMEEGKISVRFPVGLNPSLLQFVFAAFLLDVQQ